MKMRIKDAAAIAAEKEAQARAAARAQTLAYLASTDWLFVREAETGKAVPPETRAARAQARAILNG